MSPASEEELAGEIARAAGSGTTLSISGGGTRAGLGRPVDADITLSASGLTGITLYEPSELVMSARAGTPLSQVEAALAANRQRLAFEPLDCRSLYGTAGAPTVGGLAATNLSGPRRIMAGGVRDSMIGLRAVTGEGEVVKSGGRVMKNVVGYDLVKFLAGSHGTLAAFTEITFKLEPAAECERTMVLGGLSLSEAVAAMSKALGSPYQVTGAAHLPALGDRAAVTALRLEGFEASVKGRVDKLRALLKDLMRDDEVYDDVASTAFWLSHTSLDHVPTDQDTPVWRVSVKPGDAPGLMAQLAGTGLDPVAYDWGGGLIWMAGGNRSDAGASALRDSLAEFGGHATLVRAPEATRRDVAVFQPQSEPLAVLSRKLKQTFDPKGILNPGRMVAGV